MRAQAYLEVGLEHASVHVVRDPAAVHGISDEVLERPPGQELVFVLPGLGQVEAEQLAAGREVRLVEVVLDVPPDLAVLAPLQHHGVQEGQHV